MSINNDYNQIANAISPYPNNLTEQMVRAKNQALNEALVGAAQGESSLKERIKRLFNRHDSVRKQQDAYDEVLSYFEAQLNIEPFKHNKRADQIYQRALIAAIETIAKRDL